MLGAGGDSAPQFDYVFGEHATVQRILSHLNKSEAGVLRLVSRAVRVAQNHNVKTVACGLATPRLETELAKVFPHADKLQVVVDSEHVTHACILLDHILATAPVFATKLHALELYLADVFSDDDDEEITAALAAFLSRCDLAAAQQHHSSTVSSTLIQNKLVLLLSVSKKFVSPRHNLYSSAETCSLLAFLPA
jgi:hypothetical protein